MSTKTKMLAFHGNASIKAEYQARLRAHHDADEIIRGEYWDGHRGCAVGCTVEDKTGRFHASYPGELGIPESLAYLEDRIFENVPAATAPQFAVDFLEAIPVGADLAPVTHVFLAWLLADPGDGVIRFAFEDGKIAIQAVADLHCRASRGDAPTPDEWAAAETAATLAATLAAWSAWEAVGAAAWSAEAVGLAATLAAWEAVGAAAWSAESAQALAPREAFFIKMSEKLIELLKAAS